MKTLWTKRELQNLECHDCGKDLLHPPNGHLVFKTERENDERMLLDVRWVCGSCDTLRYCRHHNHSEHWNWKDIPDLFIGEVLVQWILGIMESLHTGTQKMSDEAMEKIFKFLLIIFPHISKKITPQQKKILNNLYELPRFIGGLG